MTDHLKLSHTAALILQAIDAGHGYGFGVMEVTGLPSGSVYPAVRRLERDGLVRSQWEKQSIADKEQRPPRKYYKLTPSGAAVLEAAQRRYPLLTRLAEVIKKVIAKMLLRIASLLVPLHLRRDWIAEWSAELWQIRSERRTATLFTLGSFHDALWVRRNDPQPFQFQLKSPCRCLMVLSFLAVLSLTIALVQPKSRALLLPTQVPMDCFGVGCMPIAEARSAVVRFLGMSLLVAAAFLLTTTSISLGDIPATSNSHPARRWLFLCGKAVFVILTGLGALLSAAQTQSPVGGVALVEIGMWIIISGIRWVWRDQQQRCPVCQSLLEKPITVGTASRCLIDSECSELICMRGHGLMHVSGLSISWRGTQSWCPLDSSWDELFATKPSSDN